MAAQLFSSSSREEHRPSLAAPLGGEFPWIEDGDLLVRLARDHDEVRAAQRVRFEVFALELQGRGRDDGSALDVDPFDDHCDHLLLIDRREERVVGTYRLQTEARARGGIGFYCDQEFILDDLPAEVRARSVELGRACILDSHRSGAGILALWRGIIAYTLAHGARYLFGCSSLTGVCERTARVAEAWIDGSRHRHPDLAVRARGERSPRRLEVDPREVEAFRPPRLFASYLRYSSRVCSGAALDREFGTTDFLVLFDFEGLSPRLRRLLIEG